MSTATRTPLWVKLALLVAVLGPSAWWLADRQARHRNEARLAQIASAIAGRPVQVHCPGVWARLANWDTVEGSVRFDAEGRPADEARLHVTPCAELDALAEGRRAAVLACVAAGGECGEGARELAMALDVIAHEAWHLAGVLDEAEAECRAYASMAWAGERLGATPVQARALATLHRERTWPQMPARYRPSSCPA
jgi:hypothetical protein